MSPEEIRQHVDQMVPRLNEDGTVNAQHVVMEETLRARHGHRSFIASLDGPGKFRHVTAVPPRPAAPDATAGDGLRSVLVNAIDDLFWKHDPANTDPGELRDDLLALPALRDVLAAAARDAEAIKRVRKLAKWDGGEMAAAVLHALDGTP